MYSWYIYYLKTFSWPTTLCHFLTVCIFSRSYLDYDSTLTDKDTVMLVEEMVLLSAFAVTSIKRLLFIGSILDSIKV